MTPVDLRILCTALGFTAVVMRGEKLPKKEGASRATGFANLIETFCRDAVPGAFGEAQADSGQTEFSASAELRDRMVVAVVEIITATGECAPKDLLTKGFTPVEVERHWPMAHALAKVKLNIMDS